MLNYSKVQSLLSFSQNVSICNARLKYLGEEIGQFSEMYMLGVRDL